MATAFDLPPLALLPTTAAKPRIALGAATPPRATCASRHAAITRDLGSYSKYKRWAETQRQGWSGKRDV